MGYIFISYSHKDKDYVHKLQEALQREGFEVWVDDRIDYGTEWPKVIQKHLDECDAFLVVLTDNAYESKWVQNEVARADRKKKTIFPLLLQGDGWLSVEATQYVDVTNRSLPTERFYKRLEQVVPRTKKGTSSFSLAPKPPKFTLNSKTVFWIIGVFAMAVLLTLLSIPPLTGLIQTSTPSPTIVGATISTITSIPIKTITPTASTAPTQIQVEIPINPTQAQNISINDIAVQKPAEVISDKNASLIILLAKWDIGRLASISPDGEILAVGDKNSVTLFDIYNNKTIGNITSKVGKVSTLSFSQDGSLVAIGTDSEVVDGNTEVIVWDIQAEKILRFFSIKKVTKVNSIALSPDNKRIALGLWYGIAIDIDTRDKFFYTENQFNMFSVAYSPDGKTLASGGGNWLIERPQNTLILYDIITKKRIKTLDANHGAVYSMDFTTDGKTLATGLQDGVIVVWDLSDSDYKKLLEFNTFSTSEVSSIFFSPDELILASSSLNEVKLWNASNGSLLKSLTLESKIETLTFSPDGTFIICGTNDGVVQLWGIQE